MDPMAITAVQEVVMMLIAGLTVVGIAYSPLPRLLGQRLLHGRMPPPGTPLPDPRLDDVLDENAMLRRQLSELEERLSFTERMLAQAKDRPAVGPGQG